MNVKRECELIIDDGPESGQCSDDETEQVVSRRKSKKHKRSKNIKSRKRKYSDSTSSSAKTEMEFFNPYSVNTDKFCYKSDNSEHFNVAEIRNDNNHHLINQKRSNVIDETFNNLDKYVNAPPNGNHVPKTRDSTISIFEPPPDTNVVKNNRRDFYLTDKTGIESTNADLRYFLLDVGFSNAVASDVFAVLYNVSTSPVEDVKSNHGDDDADENDEEMFNDLPIIDTGPDRHNDLNSYSPEPANNVIEPYDEPDHPISYAPLPSLLKPINDIIDVLNIPEVNPRDPRLVSMSRPLVNRATVGAPPPKPSLPTPLDCPDDKIGLPKPPGGENQTQMSKDWEVTVATMVKTHLRLYLVHNDISKDEYKSILKRAVNKIISSGEKKLETDKISKFIHSYVIMMQKSRFVEPTV